MQLRRRKAFPERHGVGSMLLPGAGTPLDSYQRGRGHVLKRSASELSRSFDVLKLAYRGQAVFSPGIEKGAYLTKVNPAEAARAKNCRVQDRRLPPGDIHGHHHFTRPGRPRSAASADRDRRFERIRSCPRLCQSAPPFECSGTHH
ncbi:hypothetical protein F01_400091 [Burkholderia cenocepacia]|nr:hypothetical protein F01_400091 [Burkholderia cenocepacia]